MVTSPAGPGQNEPPVFTVIIPTRDRPVLLREAVQSVLRQTCADFEIVVVVDGGELPAAPELDDPRVVLVRRKSSGGVSAARNDGISRARGRYVTFLDDDDVYTPERLQIARDTFEADGADVSLCAAADLHDSGNITRFGRLSGRGGLRSALDRTNPSLGCVAVRRAICPRFDETLSACEDLDWLLRLPADCRVTTTDDVGWLWRRHTGPRIGHGLEARIEGSHLLLDRHESFFAARRPARAFRLYRIGVMNLQLGRRTTARQAFWAALRVERRPGQLARILKGYARTHSPRR